MKLYSLYTIIALLFFILGQLFAMDAKDWQSQVCLFLGIINISIAAICVIKDK